MNTRTRPTAFARILTELFGLLVLGAVVVTSVTCVGGCGDNGEDSLGTTSDTPELGNLNALCRTSSMEIPCGEGLVCGIGNVCAPSCNDVRCSEVFPDDQLTGCYGDGLGSDLSNYCHLLCGMVEQCPAVEGASVVCNDGLCIYSPS